MKKPRLFKLSYFVWLIFPLLIFAAYQSYGLPHFRWSYEWRDDKQGYDPNAVRHYLRCTWVGFNGAVTIHRPENGQCDVIRFFKRT